MRKLNDDHKVYFSGPDSLTNTLKDVRKFVKKQGGFVISVDLQMYSEGDYYGWTAMVTVDDSSEWLGEEPQ